MRVARSGQVQPLPPLLLMYVSAHSHITLPSRLCLTCGLHSVCPAFPISALTTQRHIYRATPHLSLRSGLPPFHTLSLSLPPSLPFPFLLFFAPPVPQPSLSPSRSLVPATIPSRDFISIGKSSASLPKPQPHRVRISKLLQRSPSPASRRKERKRKGEPHVESKLLV